MLLLIFSPFFPVALQSQLFVLLLFGGGGYLGSWECTGGGLRLTMVWELRLFPALGPEEEMFLTGVAVAVAVAAA
jgi:hypothetical protein